ncbi:MAG: guanylate kinase [Candidatus Aminicenantaceae bacterium]
MLFVITGPSGCGKSTLVWKTLGNLKNINFSVSHTTRKKRDAETEGKDYYFVTRDEFETMIQGDKFAEWAVVHGNYYGTSKREIERKGIRSDLLLDIDIQGAEQIKEKLRKGLFVFVLPPSFRVLKKRLVNRRNEKAESVEKRLEVARKEVRHYYEFDYIIINDKLEDAVEELKAIIISSRCSLELSKKKILPILRSFSKDR